MKDILRFFSRGGRHPRVEERKSEIPPLPGVTAEVFNSQIHPWGDVRGDIKEVEERCFPRFQFQEEVLRKDFTNPDNIVVLLRLDATRIIGYTYAEPYSKRERHQSTAWVTSTAIHPDYQGKHLPAVLLGKLDDELRARGFDFMERDAVIANGYADKLERHYKKQIVEKYEERSREFGERVRFLRIRL